MSAKQHIHRLVEGPFKIQGDLAKKEFTTFRYYCLDCKLYWHRRGKGVIVKRQQIDRGKEL